LIKIQEIQELAIIASCGVAILIFTNLILLPILLSYVGVSKKAALRSLGAETVDGDLARLTVWDFLGRFTRRKLALPTVIIATLLAIGGYTVGRHAQIGNVGDGAPELRPNSQYNQDVRWTQSHYSVSSDTLTVMVDSPPYDCTTYRELSVVQKLAWTLQQMPEVQSAVALPLIIAKSIQTVTDNSPKWNAILDNQSMINDVVEYLPPGWASLDCSFMPLNISLNSLKNASLQKVVSVIQTFAANPKNQSSNFTIKLAAGNAGIAFATNRVIALASQDMLIWIYLAVAILCYITFRSWLAVLCAVLPLMLTSVLCKALMVFMHIGVTVATLPVIALGVGIGVDYALYVLGVMMTHLRAGVPLEEAYLRSLKFTGRVVMLTGFTLAVGVGTWAFAPIKFQADMGLLLAFMFLWNMFGALIILPALASFLLKPSSKTLDIGPGVERNTSSSSVSTLETSESNAGLIGSS
jgi:predicted RND superfamily exporter protein